MKKRSKRRVKWGRVLFVIIVPIIIIGGVFMYNNVLKDNNIKENNSKEVSNNKDVSNNNEEVSNKEEEVIKIDSAPLNSSEYKDLDDGEYLTSTGYKLKIENGIAYVDGNLIVNKTYSLPEGYKPSNPNQTINNEKCNNCIDRQVMDAFNLMKSDARAMGLNIYISSGYRSYSYQERLYNNYSAVDGIEGADTYSARAGHSEHQTGLCFDLNATNDSFAKTDEGIWVNENAYLYGFVIRYPKGKEKITGYQYESWHLRYVGVDLATKLFNNGNWLTLEEYYGLTSNY